MYKVSIIMPAYNTEIQIERSINSVLSQTYRNLELIIINDGSTDNTEEVILNYKGKDDRIKYIRIENSGAANARNVGLDNASGDFISFVDSDDYIDENMMEKLLEKSKEYSSEIIGCGSEKITLSKSIPIKTGLKKVYYSKIDLEERIYPYLFSTITLEDIIPKSMVGKLFNRNLIEDNNIRFISGLKYGEDLIFTESCFLYTNSFFYLPEEELYKYVYNESSITNRYVENLWENSKKGIVQRGKIADNFTEYNLKSQLPYAIVRYAMTAVANIGRNSNTDRLELMTEINNIITDTDLQQALKQVDINNFSFVRRILAYNMKSMNIWSIYILLKMYRLTSK